MRIAAYKGAAAVKRKVLLVILAGSLVCAWGGVGFAGQIGYSMRSAEKGFAPKPEPGVPSSSVMFADTIIARPLGLAATIVGPPLFVITLPFTLPSETTGDAAWGLMGRPAGWTFMRPLGRGAPVYQEKGVFSP
jgi:hypothetical protein